MISPSPLTKSDTSDYPSLDRIKWFRKQLSTWGVANRRDFQWRKTTDSYHLLVAESLLQKTDAQTVAPIYELFIEHYPTIEDLAAANLDNVAQLLKPLGLFFRAERLQHDHARVGKCARHWLETAEDGDGADALAYTLRGK